MTPTLPPPSPDPGHGGELAMRSADALRLQRELR